MDRPASIRDLQRKLSALRALDLLGGVDLPFELEDLEKRVYELTEVGNDELESWAGVASEPPGAWGVSSEGLRSLDELEGEIETWQASLAARYSHARVGLLTDEYRLRALQHRRAFVRDAIDARGSARAPRVLVAVDSVAWRARARHLLTRAGYEVRLADDAAHAWTLLQSVYFDALVLHAGGDRHGVELIHSARASNALSDLPIVMSGASSDPEEREAAFAAGADAYVWNCDPETGRQLVDAIEDLIGGDASAD
jgi:CheY-like chemotaxis protein